MKTDLAPTSSDLSLLPRADLPVIWDGFAAKAEQLRTTAETLTVTSVEQKAEMELARTTRLTLKQIRVEVEKKRIELGEGHLTEIQKINGAAKKLKEMIEPLEARLLHQEQFAERVEADQVLELTKRRSDEIRSVSPTAFIGSDLGKMPQDVYDAHMARLRAEVAEIEEAKRRQAEVEAELAAQQAESKRRQVEADAALAEQQAEARAEQKRRDDEAECIRAEQEEKFKAELSAASAQRTLEREAAEKRRQEDLRTAEAKRLELEVQLANERAAKLAEERRLLKLALAPDVEQLKAFSQGIYNVPQPWLKTKEASAILERAQGKLAEAMLIIDVFCADDDLTSTRAVNL